MKKIYLERIKGGCLGYVAAPAFLTVLIGCLSSSLDYWMNNYGMAVEKIEVTFSIT